MTANEWIALAGLAVVLAGVIAGFGVAKAKLAACERRLDNLEAVRDRMGAQLHRASAAIRVLAAVVHERSGRRNTLASLASGEGEEAAPAAEQPAESSGEET